MSWAEAERIAAAEGLTFVQNERSNSGFLGVYHKVKRGLDSREKGTQEYYSATVTRKQMDESGEEQSTEQRFLGQYGSVARAALEVARTLGSTASAVRDCFHMIETLG